jgi:hypothetical protein
MERRWVSVPFGNKRRMMKILFSLIAVNYEARDFGVKRGKRTIFDENNDIFIGYRYAR